MKNSFLIINYNDYESTSSLLNNIKNYTCLDKIVVVDNASNDGSYEKLIEKYQTQNISIIKNVANNGYASAINFGVKYLEEKLGESNIIVSNADIVIYCEEDLTQLIQSKNKDCAILAPIIKEHTGLNRGWKIPTPLQDGLLNLVFIHKFIRPLLIYYKDKHYHDELVEVEAVSGCFFLIDSKYLKQVKYFDENTFLYYEENIISKKIETIHKKIIINTKVEVLHNHSISIDKSIKSMKKYQILKKSQFYFQTKYNHANWVDRGFLKFTSGLSYFILKVFKR